MNIKDMTKISLFTAITVVCSQISLQIGTIPFTLQTFAVFLGAAVLGFKKGVLSTLVYILLGVVGLPVFSGFRGGIGVLFGTTGGYIWGFLISAAVIGFMTEKFGKSLLVTIGSMILGLILCYAVGSLQYMLLYTKGPISFGAVVATCVMPFIPIDAVKIFLAALISTKIKPLAH